MSIEQTHHSDLIAYDPSLAYFPRIEADPVPISPENQHFTVYNISNMRHEIARQGSGEIVDILHLFQLCKRPEVAFFDIHGDFYSGVVLKALHEHAKVNGNKIIKHDALFYSENDQSSFSIPIDNIHCISGSYRPEKDLNY